MNTIDLHIHITVDNLSEVIQQIVSAFNADKAPVMKTHAGEKPKDPITVKTRQRKQRVLELVKDNSEPKCRTFSEKTCIQCEKLFTPHSGRQAKCDECRSDKTSNRSPIAYSDQQITKICPRCGKEFQTIKTNRVFCYDRNCLKQAGKTKETAATAIDTNNTSEQDSKEEWTGHTYQHTCRSCGRIFFTEMPETDRELCNENCRPLTAQQTEQRQEMINSGNMFADLSKEKCLKPKQKNTNGKRKENNRN